MTVASERRSEFLLVEEGAYEAGLKAGSVGNRGELGC